ncbi:MAG TPA: 5,6-dimethylbenzimidazole synthase [Streptosporangiaceae bacterium]|jgi:nicotinate-nucleotide--dimethylbenzimidazole phosphoribosyltransferase
MTTETPPHWPRPRPLVGDPTSSAERASDPASWALPESVRAALSEVVAARRDVRRFRADAVSDELVASVLAAGHAAPSVGHSQPWRFIVVRDPQLRASAAVMADRARLAQARQLDADSARHLRSLQLEGIREAPVGVVVCCDRRARPAGVLGRATFPDTDLWSCACAIENIWLTARAHGLGLGWVTLFEPAELAALLHLPDGVQTLGWLCLGWPDERPPAPGLERQGWSRRLPLADVLAADRWPESAAPAPRDRSADGTPQDAASEPAETAPAAGRAVSGREDGGSLAAASGPAPPRTAAASPFARVRARDDEDRLLAAPGSLGLLGDTLVRAGSLASAAAGGSPVPEAGPAAPAARGAGARPGTLLIAAADHPVTGLGVSAFPRSTTRLVARALAAGQGQGAAMAATAGLAVRLADCGIDGEPIPGWRDARPAGPRGDLAAADAMTPQAAAALLAAGEQAGRELAAAGPLALGEVGIGNTTIAAAVAAALLDLPAGEAAGRGAGSDTAIVTRKRAVIEQALARLGPRLDQVRPRGGQAGIRPADGSRLDRGAIIGLLAGIGGPEQAYLTGACLGAAQAGGLVVLDGLLTGTSALLAVRHQPAVQDHLIAGHLSAEPAHRRVLDALGLEPLLDLRLRAGEGVGAVLAISLLSHAQRARAGTAATD